MKSTNSVTYKGHSIAVSVVKVPMDMLHGTEYIEEVRVAIDGADVTEEVITPMNVTVETMVEYAKQYIDNLSP